MKLTKIATALSGVGLMMGLSGPAMSQDITDPDGCETTNNVTQCAFPGFSLTEKYMVTLLEQHASIAAGLADGFGCTGVAGTRSINVNVNNAGGTSKYDGYTVQVALRADGPGAFKEVTRIETSDATPGTVAGQFHSGLVGTFTGDEQFSIMYGGADWNAGSARLDEHIIKDFYLGAAKPPVIIDNPANPSICPIGSETLADFLGANPNCLVTDAGDYNPFDPVTVPRVVRDSGLEVITKKVVTDDLIDGGLIDIGAPKGKWRQTSFYRQPNGGGHGRIVFRKVRVAPFDKPDCMLVMDLNLSGNQSTINGSGTITHTPL